MMIPDNGITSGMVLTARIKGGDHEAFEILFRKYYKGLVVFADNFILDRDAAEEIVQSFFMKLWEKRHRLDPSQPLKSYLFTSIKNRCLNHLKRKNVVKESIDRIREASESHLLFDENLYHETELRTRIEECVDALPDRCREVFLLSRRSNLKNEEIADQLNLSKRTVEKHISNALQLLRRHLTEYSHVWLGLLKL